VNWRKEKKARMKLNLQILNFVWFGKWSELLRRCQKQKALIFLWFPQATLVINKRQSRLHQALSVPYNLLLKHSSAALVSFIFIRMTLTDFYWLLCQRNLLFFSLQWRQRRTQT
jgi:hypothetical protein